MRSAVLASGLAVVLALFPGSSAASAAPDRTARAGHSHAEGRTSPVAATSRGDPGWVWPVDGGRWVLRDFVAPPTAYGAGHRGVDLAAPAPSAEVRAPVGGVVHFAGVVVDRPLVTVRTGQLLVTMEPVEPLVAEGDIVRAGDPLGTLVPGHCSRACVHLGVRLAGEYVSPLLYLGGLQRAVLLPLGPGDG